MKKETPLKKIFLGPKAENSETWDKYFKLIFDDYVHWRRNYFPSDKIVIEHSSTIQYNTWIDSLDYELNNTLNNLKAHFPFYSPRYMAHMLSEQILPSVLGYFAGMLYNPNNVTSEAAPVTVDMEIEFGQKICQMLGYKSSNNKPTGWAHICSGGSLANMEALWVAREIQFIPLCVKEFCIKNKIVFEIKTPNMVNDEKINIAKVDDKTLLSLKTNEKIYMLTKLIQKLASSIGNSNVDSEERMKLAINRLNDFLTESNYSVRYNGFANVLSKVGLKPVLFVPESAHYSWDKAAAILGYGKVSIRKIPLNSKFRIDTEKLEKMLFNLQSNEYIVAVVAVVGTTEEGAVDPIHIIKFLRDRLEKEKNMSFWLHIDSAWGGYIRSLFNDDNYSDLAFNSGDSELVEKYNKQLEVMRNSLKKKGKICTKLDEAALKCYFIMNIIEEFVDDFTILDSSNNKKKISIAWGDLEVIKAFMAFEDADSITVDPHKLGYVPYPAGVIAFKNRNVTQFIAQKASYISESKGGVEKVSIDEIDSVGPYIIEGSKPGAAAVACWLSERTIPMNLKNHGKIIKTTLLNAKKFYYYISKFNHEAGNYFAKNKGSIKRPYKIVPLYDNIDTNIVCFVILPMVWNNKGGAELVIPDTNLSLAKINEVNKSIYKYFTITNEKGVKAPPHSQKFFLSRTELDKSQYDYNSIKKTLNKLDINKEEYKAYGLFVLRATLMNPWYYESSKEDAMGKKTDYFLEFFKELNNVVLTVINSTEF